MMAIKTVGRKLIKSFKTPVLSTPCSKRRNSEFGRRAIIGSKRSRKVAILVESGLRNGCFDSISGPFRPFAPRVRAEKRLGGLGYGPIESTWYIVRLAITFEPVRHLF